MPVFEYECTKCHKVIEVQQKIKDPSPKSCKDCGGDLQRILSTVSHQYKGSGFFATDYKRRGR